MSDVGQPKPFPTRPLAQIASRITDGSHFSPTPQMQGHLIANVKDMKSGRIDFDSCTRISTLAFRELKATGCVIKKGNVLLSKDGTVGRVVVYESEQEIGALSSICLITPQVEQHPRFLGHALQSHDCVRQYENAMSGSALRRLVLRDIRQIRVPTPAVDEQATVAEILDTLDSTIRQTEAIIEKLKQVKQGLLHDLLTRGIDANGELRPPQSQAPHLYKESPLGRIPGEWDASTVAVEFDVCSGITLGPHRVPRSSPRKYLRVANVQRARIDLADVLELEATDAEMANRALAPGDLLIVEGHASPDEIGRCAMATDAVRGFTFQNHLFRLRTRRLRPLFALQWMNSNSVRAYWRTEAATSSGLNTINRTKLSRVIVAVPPVAEQQHIVDAIAAADKRCLDEASLLTKLTVQKSGLMDDLLTGRVRVTTLLQGSGQCPSEGNT